MNVPQQPSILSVQNRIFDVTMDSQHAEMPTPEALGLEAGQWVGSLVQLRPEFIEKMKSTTVEPLFNMLVNPHVDLPLALVIEEPISPDYTFVVTAVSESSASTTYKRNGWVPRHAYLRAFCLRAAISAERGQATMPRFYSFKLPVNVLNVVQIAKPGTTPVSGVDYFGR